MAVQNATEPKLILNASRQFTAWLAEQQISLAFTTYQAAKVFFIGSQPDGNLSVFERTFSRCMGLYAKGSSLYTSSLYQLWRFENAWNQGRSITMAITFMTVSMFPKWAMSLGI
jgi:uncharacterized protein (TIGR03032 family)